MAELYENPKQYLTAGGYTGSTPTGEPSFEDMLAGLPPEEREEAMQYITAPPSGEEIMKAMQQKNSQGEVMNMSLDQYRLFKAHNKTKEVDVIAGIGEAASTVFEEISKAAGSIVDNPADALQKLTPSVIEAFAQGTRNMYGMAAQSADPNSVFFRMKNALQANGDDEEAELQQFMEAQAFNVHSMRLMTGQDTLIMDKDVINPEMTQVMSYIADPTLFVPFGGIAAKGAVMIGMGEKLAMAAARTQGIRNLVLGGAIKWGVGAPLEFMGGAIRNTIDYGIDTGSRVFETATGVAAKDIASATRVGTLGTAAGSVAGLEVNSTLGTASRYYAGSLVARNIGEAASIYGEQMMKQGKTGRGVLGYAGQAIRDTERAGIKLAPHTKSLLKAIEAVDPLFVYADDIAQGAAQGAIIGGGLGYLAGGEEGFAGGVGSGMALGTVGATAGKVVADVTGNTKIDQMRIQRKLIIEALKENGNENAVGFEAMAAMAEATGDRAFQGYIDGIIAGIDTVNPDAVFKAFNKVQYETHLKSKGIDPNTGVLLEKSRIFPELNDRTVKADVLGILRDTGGNFAGDPAGFEQAVKSNPAFAKVKPIWNRLDDNAKQVILKQIKDNGDPAFTKSLKGRQLNAHWSDMAYAEKATEIVNTLNQKNANSVPAKVAELLKAETRPDKKLTRRGQMLKEKLQADGYIDKDGNVRTSRLKDVEGTQREFEASAGWAKSRDSSGRTEVVINLDKWAMDSGNRLSLAHELYHSIMLDSVFAPDYIDRLSQKLLGKFDPKTGRILEQALVQPDELMKFFGKYIDNDPSNRGDAETIKRKKEELKKSIEDYRTRGTANRVADATAIPLEHLVEEFGAYYFSKWVKAKPIDYMFRGGEFSGIRGLMEMASDGWLDYWKGKINEKNPQFDFDGMGVSNVSKAFERDGKRVSSRSLDLFMRDIVRIEANRNSNNGFDVNKLSKESREWFLKVNGLRGAAFGQLDQQGNIKKPKLRRYTAEEIRQGKEMFKVMESLPDAAHKDGMRRDGDGNWSGQPNTAQINALVGAGFIQRAWFDRMNRAFDIVNGNGSNVVEFGYLGYSAHIGDGNERVYGAAVPFKNRRAVLIGVDFKVRADGTVYSNLHTLDLKVIEARGNEVWKDPQTRELWKGSRTNMEADFYAYLSNASLPSGHPDRKPSARLLDNSDGLGGQRRDALHQMLGFHKGSDMPYINRPISEIPIGIRHSVTTFSNDGIVNMRVDNKPRYDFNFENAHLDLSRNFMPDEMRQETTPSGGKIIKHATGYNISKQAGNKFKVFDPEGKMLGAFDTVADAGRAAQKHYNETFDKSVEGKDAPVPPTEIPPSRVAYVEKEFAKGFEEFAFNEKIKPIFIKAIDKHISEFGHHIEKESILELTELRDALINNDKNEKFRTALKKTLITQPSLLAEARYRGEETAIINHLRNIETSAKENAGKEYDAMYPMEIKSALHPRLAQIFQDYPNLTAQGLLKKLVVYGSQGSRMFQEATEIGLVDLLKSKIQKTITPRFLPDGTRVDMAQGVTQPKLEMSEILDFAKAKEIKVTIEEGARERSGMDTSKYTLGGAKANYKETAVRINPEYAHGISGHYGEDTIVHFRTTERIDADGNRHLFIEEVQANNSDINTKKTSEKEIQAVRDELKSQKEWLTEGIKNGAVIEIKNLENGKLIDYISASVHVKNSSYETKFNKLVSDVFSGSGQGYTEAIQKMFLGFIKETADTKGGANRLFGINNSSDYVKDRVRNKEFITENKVDAIISSIEYQEYATRLFDAYRLENKHQKGTFRYASTIIERISDTETRLQQLEAEKTVKPLPLTAAKDWTLTALKGIIRQAIRDGLDRITLTHPDDSPTVSHMAGDARRGLYGKLMPEVWGSWLRKYGIEMKQTNKLADATIDTAKAQMAEITNKLHDANKAVLEHFEQVKGGEDPATINKLAELMAMPVHEADGRIDAKIRVKALDINDNKLRDLISEVSLLKGAELNAYNKVQKLRESGIRGDSDLKSDTDAGISAEAIDRGMTFELNDRLKRDFLDGKIQTHMMPAEGEQGGRVYTDDQFNKDFIGKFAEENPDIANKFLLRIKENDGETMEEWDYKMVIYDKDTKKPIARTKWELFENDEGILEDAASDVEILDQAYKGMKLSHLMQSERLERSRFLGAEKVRSQITNEEGIPVKNYAKTIGADKGEITSSFADRFDEDGVTKYIPATMENFKQEMDLSKKHADNTWKPTVYYRAELDPKGRYMPAEGEQGGRVYDQNSREFKTGFIGKWAEENPERLEGYNLEFIDRGTKYGTHNVRIRLQDNSVKGKTEDVGHITADIDPKTKVASLNSNIGIKYRGNKLSYALYSEMAERLRSMGVEKVDGTIVNPEGIPIKVRERIIGNTRVLRSDDSIGLPIDYKQGARIIQRRQAEGGNTWGGLDVVNELDPKARYMPEEDIGSPQNVTEVREWLSEVRKKEGDYTVVPMSESIKQTFGNLEAFKKARKEDMLTALETATRYGSQQEKDFFESVKSGKTSTKNISEWMKKNGDFYTYNYELKNIRAVRDGLAKEVLRAMGEMRKISDKDGRRYNTEGEREHRNTTYMPSESKAEIPLAAHQKPWSGNKFVLIDVKKFNDEFQRTNPNDTVRDVKNQKPNSLDRATKWIEERPWEREKYREMAEAPVVSVFPEKTFIKGQGAVHQVRVSNGRHRLQAYENLGIKYAWVQTPIKEEGRLNQFRVSKEGTGRFMPSEYQGGDDYYKPKKNPFESKDDQGMLVRKFVIEGKDGVDEYNPDGLSYIQIGHGSSPLGYYGYKNVEIDGKEHRLNEVLYFINNDGKFISKKMTPEDNKTHSQYAKDSSDVSMRMHPMGYKYADAIQGRVEMPIYEKGELIRKGVASIIDFAKDKLLSSSDVIKAKNKIAKELKINAEDFDLHMFEAPAEIKAQRGYGSKDALSVKFMPAEFTEFKSEQSATGRIMRNARGYVIMLANNKFRVYNPSKAIIGVYTDEEQAKKRIYKEIPKR